MSDSLGGAAQGAQTALRATPTLKGQHTFSTMEELRRALLDSADRNNEHWLVNRHNVLSPSQVRRELMQSKQAA
jgi:hypothetical protein